MESDDHKLRNVPQVKFRPAALPLADISGPPKISLLVARDAGNRLDLGTGKRCKLVAHDVSIMRDRVSLHGHKNRVKLHDFVRGSGRGGPYAAERARRVFSATLRTADKILQSRLI